MKRFEDGNGEGRVVWGDARPDGLVSSRGRDATRYEVDEADAWSAVLGYYESRRLSGLASGKARTSSRGAALADAILATVDSGVAADEEAGAALLIACTYWGTANSRGVARWMIARHGLEFTTRAALIASGLGRDGNGDDYYVFERSYAAQLMVGYRVERSAQETANSLIDAFLELRRADGASTDGDHAAAVAAVREHWGSLGDPGRVLAAIAFPSDGFWRQVEVPELLWGEGYYTRYSVWLITAPDDAEAAAVFAAAIPTDYVDEMHAFAVVDRLGVEAVKVFDQLGSRGCVVWSPTLEVLESAAAFELHATLGQHALPYAHVLQRRPGLAVRALAPIAANSRSAHRSAARVLLARVVTSAREAASSVLGELDERSAAALRDVSEPPASPAPASELPPFLTAPPWLQKRKKTKLVTVDLEPMACPPAVHMSAEERSAIMRGRYGDGVKSNQAVIDEIRRRLDRGGWYGRDIWAVAAIDSWEAARGLIAELKDEDWQFDSWSGECAAPVMVARWGVEAGEFFERFGHRDRVNTVRAAILLEDARLAPVVAESFSRLKTARAAAAAWLERYPRAAAVGLIPLALGKAKKPREYAENALRHVATAHPAVVAEVAAEYGQPASQGVEQLLAIDPFDQIPSRPPKLPPWWSAAAFPRLVTRASGAPLDDATMDAAVTALALSSLDSTYPGVPALAELCTAASLERFALALFDAWLSFGADSKSYWGLFALGWFGGDEAARTLAPLIRRWPGESAAKRATTGLDVLATIGSDVALMHIYAISQKVKYASIKKRAGELVDQLASELGLSRDELGDRLVPDFDLEPDGSTVISYGSRSFTVRFDESLTPVVIDEKGKVLKTLPKPGKKDGDGAADEQKRFRGLKKDVKAVASQQIQRLEHAMCVRRRWSEEDFRDFFVGHPLVINLTRRLVWATYDGASFVRAFRVDEEGQFVDADDHAVAIDGLEVGLAHAAELGAGASAWNTVFADYELLQPFPQLGREVWAPGQTEFLGTTLPAPKLVFGLERRGWRRGEAIDGGAFYSHDKEFGDVRAYIEYEGAVGMGYIEKDEPLKITVFRFLRGSDELSVDEIEPITFSEAVRDIVRTIR